MHGCVHLKPQNYHVRCFSTRTQWIFTRSGSSLSGSIRTNASYQKMHYTLWIEVPTYVGINICMEKIASLVEIRIQEHIFKDPKSRRCGAKTLCQCVFLNIVLCPRQKENDKCSTHFSCNFSHLKLYTFFTALSSIYLSKVEKALPFDHHRPHS